VSLRHSAVWARGSRATGTNYEQLARLVSHGNVMQIELAIVLYRGAIGKKA
jgi:hypothetical protein